MSPPSWRPPARCARALRCGTTSSSCSPTGRSAACSGSQAFLEQDPWAYAAGVVLNFDSPGSSSPALMYETSPQNGRLISHYLGAGRAYGSSLMYEVSRRQPVVSDFRPFVAKGIPGMTFGMLDGPAYDHTAYDSLGVVPRGGPAARGRDRPRAWPAASATPTSGSCAPPTSSTSTSPAASPCPIRAPTSLRSRCWRVALFAVAVALAARRRLLTLRGVAWAALGTGATLGASLLVVAFVWTMYRTAYEERVWTGTGVVISDWYRLGLVLLAAAVVLGIYAALLRRLRAWDLAVVALAWWAAGSVVVSLAFPGASYLLTWSLVGGALGLGRRRPRRPARRTAGRRRRSSPSPAPCPG